MESRPQPDRGRADPIRLTHHLLDSLCDRADVNARVGGRDARREYSMWAQAEVCPAFRWRSHCRPVHVTLLDKVAKKTAFLRQAQLELGCRTSTSCRRASKNCRASPFDVIVARAFARCWNWSGSLACCCAEGGCWCAMKGTLPRDEIEQLGRRAQLGVRIAARR